MMRSKSNVFAVLYAVAAAVTMALYLTGALSSIMSNMGLPPYHADVMAVLWLLAAWVACLFAGADKLIITIVGTLAGFVVLTASPTLLPMVRYLALGAVLFAIGVYGLVTSRNAIRMLISIELMINAANINFVTFAKYVDPGFLQGQIFAIFVLAVAAAEAAVGLAIVLAIYRNISTVDMESFNLLKW